MLRDDDNAARRQQKLERINDALLDRLSRVESRRGSGWVAFQAAAALEKEVAARNRDLEIAMQKLSERNRELALARAAAEDADRSKTRFLRAASHDLIQPLAAAKLFLQALADTPLNAPQTDLVQRLSGAFTSVEELMQSVLEIARLDSQRITFARQAVALGPMLDRLGAEFAPLARAKGLVLRVVDSSVHVDSDPVYLRRIIQNLLANAIKYTNHGRVLLGVRCIGGQIRIEVHDTGVGIAEADRARIFDEFQRLQNDGVAGMGVGLSIVRRVCARLGHRVDVISQPGRGSCFRVVLARACGAVAPQPTPDSLRPRVGLSGLKAILIENDTTLRRAYEMMLAGRFGMEVMAFAGSADAIDATREAPDVIIADYNLDHGDTGLLAIAGLRAAFGAVPAMVVTARSDDDVMAACAGLGVPVHTKPISRERLRQALENTISEQR